MKMNYKEMINRSFAKIQEARKKDGFDEIFMNNWEWWSGIALYGVIKIHEATGEEKYLEFLRDWIETNIGTRRNGSVNRVLPCCALDYVDMVDNSDKYANICKEYEDWCLHTSVRTSNNGIAHLFGPDNTCSEIGHPELKYQLWDDSLMMACIFMARYGQRVSRPMLDEAIKQIKIHLSCLYNSEDRLCYHAYDCRLEKNLGQYWGRGNGWIVVTLGELLKVTTEEKIENSYFIEIFKNIMESAYEKRSENGMLHTVIDYSESYIEMTASLLFGYAALVGYELGILESKYLDWAIEVSRVIEFNEDGTVKYCSGGTGPEALEVYLNKPFMGTMYAYGLVILFLSQLIKVRDIILSGQNI